VQRCAECNGRRLAFTSARAAVVYDAPVRALVGAWKERGQRGVAAIAAELIEETIRRPDVNAVVPVAADGGRRARRGHSPAARLANEIGARWDLPVRDVLVRAEGRRPQRGLALVERRRNVSGAFVAVTAVPARVVVVDDVYTSGATVAAAASALRKGGAEHVQVVTFARAVR
jgi:predicted amidophosphoribosyltransferase